MDDDKIYPKEEKTHWNEEGLNPLDPMHFRNMKHPKKVDRLIAECYEMFEEARESKDSALALELLDRLMILIRDKDSQYPGAFGPIKEPTCGL